jgi:hypothetical protein
LKRQRYTLLKWFFEFAYMDFGQMSDDKLNDTRAMLTVMLSHGVWSRPDDEAIKRLMLHYQSWLDVSRGIGHGHSSVELEPLKAYQVSFRQQFNKLMDSMASLPSSDTDTMVAATNGSLGPFYVLTQHFMPAALLQAQITTMRPQKLFSKQLPQRATKISEIFDMTEVPAGMQFFKKGWKKNARIQVDAPHTDPAALLGAIFLRELNGVPLSVIRRCKGCTHWFVHATARERQFCTNRCAARHLMRASRAKIKMTEPERYKAGKESGRKRAGKSYRKKCGLA